MAGGREGGLAIIKPACSALLAHAVRADVQQWRAGLIARTQPVIRAENDALPRDQDRRSCDVRIKFEIEAWPAVKTAGDVGPFLIERKRLHMRVRWRTKQPESRCVPGSRDQPVARDLVPL